VEDRLTPELWLDLADMPAETYRADVLEPTANLDRVERATWWVNAHPNRRDLPRTLPEFETLGLYELTPAASHAASHAASQAAPIASPQPEVTRLHFGRTPRPGQGVQTGLPTIGLLLVLISPTTPEAGQALRDWADFVHIRHIAAAAVPGYGMITPYERIDRTGPARYLHLYEIDDDDPESVFRSMVPKVIERMGPTGTAAFDQWAGHPALVIDYVNTFRLVGAV
jgi:hypothetical protein